MSARSPEGRDAEYIEWHALDHLPEQYRITGMRAGTRWASTPECRSARAVSGSALDAVDHVVMYLFGDPVDAALDDFFALGAQLRGAGRMPLSLPCVELGGYLLDEMVAAPRVLVDASVLPWRPATGAYLLVTGGGAARPELVDVPGVAGLWSFVGSGSIHPRLASTAGQRLTVCYLDDDPVAVAHRLRDRVGPHALLAAPFEGLTVLRLPRVVPRSAQESGA